MSEVELILIIIINHSSAYNSNILVKRGLPWYLSHTVLSSVNRKWLRPHSHPPVVAAVARIRGWMVVRWWGCHRVLNNNVFILLSGPMHMEPTPTNQPHIIINVSYLPLCLFCFVTKSDEDDRKFAHWHIVYSKISWHLTLRRQNKWLICCLCHITFKQYILHTGRQHFRN